MEKCIASVLIIMSVAGTPGYSLRNVGYAGMFDLYDANRREGIGNYVTEDFILLSYGMVYGTAVRQIEEKELLPKFRSLMDRLFVLLSRPDSDEIHRANLDFVMVLRHLLGKARQDLSAKAKSELEKIQAAKGILWSDLFQQNIDYSQFQVRAGYAKGGDLARYFQAVRYAGTVLFAVKESNATGITSAAADRLTAQALALATLLASDSDLRESYSSLLSRWDWLIGPSDDMTLDDLVQAGSSGGMAMAEVRTAAFAIARERRHQPRIPSGLVDVSRLEAGVTAKDVLTGWRFLPPRYTPDSAAMQLLVYDKVRTYLGKADSESAGVIGGERVKVFPLSLELMSLLGSNVAAERLDQRDERNYTNYAEAANAARQELLQEPGSGIGAFQIMRVWLRDQGKDVPDATRRLNSMLALWTRLRYDTLLYTKQSYTAVNKGVGVFERSDGWLEPAVELYLMLRRQASRLYEQSQNPLFKAYASLLDTCIDISLAEREGLPLSPEQVRFINDLDRTLLQLAGSKDSPVVVDVHTDPTSGLVLQEATGFPAIIKHQNGQRETRGALFTHYEFKHPLSERLTDELWLEKLQKEERN
jgi:hypothetical protein